MGRVLSICCGSKSSPESLACETELSFNSLECLWCKCKSSLGALGCVAESSKCRQESSLRPESKCSD